MTRGGNDRTPRAMGQYVTGRTDNLLIVVIAASGNPVQTKKNVKITSINNCDFIKINEYKQQYETDKHESSDLSARILCTLQSRGMT